MQDKQLRGLGTGRLPVRPRLGGLNPTFSLSTLALTVIQICIRFQSWVSEKEHPASPTFAKRKIANNPSGMEGLFSFPALSSMEVVPEFQS